MYIKYMLEYNVYLALRKKIYIYIYICIHVYIHRKTLEVIILFSVYSKSFQMSISLIIRKK